MSIRILPPANSQERLARQRGLGSYRQQRLEVRAFAQFFWTMSRGLEYQNAALKDIFNLCLDNPLPQWEMEQLRILNFFNYVHHRKDLAYPFATRVHLHCPTSRHSLTESRSCSSYSSHIKTPVEKEKGCPECCSNH